MRRMYSEKQVKEMSIKAVQNAIDNKDIEDKLFILSGSFQDEDDEFKIIPSISKTLYDVSQPLVVDVITTGAVSPEIIIQGIEINFSEHKIYQNGNEKYLDCASIELVGATTGKVYASLDV